MENENTEFKGNHSKKRPKNPIKFKIQLNEEQKEAKLIVLENDITLLKGSAGSGKTLLATQIALDLLFNKQIERIIICRPTISNESIGFLPGSFEEKLTPWLSPIYSNLYILYDKEKIDKLIEEKIIDIVPFSFMRGRTFTNALVIADECQNVTNSQMEMVIGRLGKGSKMILCGDTSQIDLPRKKDSGLDFLKIVEANVPGFRIVTLKKNHRHEIVQKILDVYSQYTD